MFEKILFSNKEFADALMMFYWVTKTWFQEVPYSKILLACQWDKETLLIDYLDCPLFQRLLVIPIILFPIRLLVILLLIL